MKRVIISTLFFFAGCSTNAWYQSGKTLAQASTDCEQCKYDVMKHHNPYSKPQSQIGYFVGTDTEMLMQCMKLRGYAWTNVTEAVKNGWVRIQTNSFDPWYSVAGD